MPSSSRAGRASTTWKAGSTNTSADGGPMHALALLAPAAAVDALSDLLADELDALAVSIEDADAGSDAEQPVFDEPGVAAGSTWAHARVTALFVDEARATAAAAAVAARGSDEIHVVAIAAVEDHDWVR